MTYTKPTKSIKLIIDSDLEAVIPAGLAVRALCTHAELDEVAVFQVELAVVEAVTNVIKHAYGNARGHEVEIFVSVYPDELTFRIRDNGRPLEEYREAAMELDPGNLDTLPESGMGLHIIRSVMDRVHYERIKGQNILVLSKYFKR